MHCSSKLTFCIGLLLATFVAQVMDADDHVVVERVRAGLGMRFPAQVTEIWLSDSSVYSRSRRFVVIDRYDRGIRWTLNPRTKRFFEEPLKPTENSKEVPIQRAGWKYNPTYEWSVLTKATADTVGRRACNVIDAKGEADYSSEAVRLWISSDVPINIERFNDRVESSSSDFDWKSLVTVYPRLQRMIILKAVNEEEPAIAPAISYEATVTTLEQKDAPPGIYQIPEGYTKVNDEEELTK